MFASFATTTAASRKESVRLQCGQFPQPARLFEINPARSRYHIDKYIVGYADDGVISQVVVSQLQNCFVG